MRLRAPRQHATTTIQFGGYRFHEELYRSEDTVVCRGIRELGGNRSAPVVAKIVSAEHPQKIDTLRHEYAILQTLSAPSIVQPLDLVPSTSGLALILEDRGGTVLSEVIEGARLSFGDALRLGEAIVAALVFMHDRGVIHKDLKPHNVLVSETRDSIQIIDFGIASRIAEEAQKNVDFRAFEGTLLYVSPEQTGRTSQVVDHRSDLYSFGVMFYEMLTGRVPFDADDPELLVHDHLTRTPSAPNLIDPSIPEVVAAIVQKTLEKDPDDRYQSAEGLRKDLAVCRKQWEASGTISPFEPGQHDVRKRIRVPTRMLGRAAERKVLRESFDRMRQGTAEMVVLSGATGSGKSMLLSSLARMVAPHGGYFLFGRTRTTSALCRAVEELAARIAAEFPTQRDAMVGAILHAVGPNAAALVEFAPGLTRILGTPPPCPAVRPAAAARRLYLALLHLFSVMATFNRPVVVALDDMDVDDQSSCKQIHALATSSGLERILFVVAVRAATAEAWATPGVTLVHLDPLNPNDIRAIVADTIGADDERISVLADAVGMAAEGNARQIGQTLEALEDEAIIRFDEQTLRLEWSDDEVRDRLQSGTAEVFVDRRIARLPPRTRELLEIAACAGRTIDFETWMVVSGRSAEEMGEALVPAMEDRLLVHVTEGHGMGRRYRFLHEALPERMVARMDVAQRQRTHLALGRLLLSTPEGQQTRRLEAIQHLVAGAPMMTDCGERVALAQECLVAGQQARGWAAFRQANHYFAAGIEALVGTAGNTRSLAWSLHLGRAECLFLAGDQASADKLHDELLQQNLTRSENIELRTARVVLWQYAGRIDEAFAAGIEALSYFALELPRDPAIVADALSRVFAEVDKRFATTTIDALLAAPAISDAELIALLELLANVHPSAYMKSPQLAALILLRMTYVSLEHGKSPLAPFAYAGYGMMLAAMHRRYRESLLVGDVALALQEQLGHIGLATRTYVNVAAFSHFTRPREESLTRFRQGYDVALATGEYQYLAFACSHIARTRMSLGHELTATLHEIERMRTLVDDIGETFSGMQLTILRQEMACLLGQTKGPTELDDDGFSSEACVAFAEAKGLRMVLYSHDLARLVLHVFHGRLDAALDLARSAESRVSAVTGLYHMTELSFYGGLVLAATQSDESTLTRYLHDLATWAETCPSHYRNKYHLVLATRHRMRGEVKEALGAYEQSIRAARDACLVHEEALANEFVGRYCLDLGAEKAATTYLIDAYQAYLRWGAVAKTKSLAAEFVQRLAIAAVGPRQTDAVSMSKTRSRKDVAATLVGHARQGGAGYLELSAVMRAARTITTEIMPENVLRSVMKVIVQNAGANAGVWLRKTEDKLVAEALFMSDPERIFVGNEIGAHDATSFAQSLVDDVVRHRESVVLDDAARGIEYAQDPYFIRVRPRSVMGFPVMHHEHFVGVMYLENTRIPGTFVAERVDLCLWLAAQAAVTLENARLYGHVTAISAELKRAKTRLEMDVAQRTKELLEANEKLMFELHERARTEDERASLQEQIIRTQQARIREMSTPFLPISESIMVMPIIGSVDAARAQQLSDTALEGAARSHAETVIFDITGVTSMDDAVVQRLLGAATALQLLGVRPILTGIRADVAQAMIAHGEQLARIATRSTLRAGITLAMSLAKRHASKG